MHRRRPGAAREGQSVVLVDSSVWIAELRTGGVIAANVVFEEVAICPVIMQEVLQGIRSETFYRMARGLLMSVEMLDLPLDLFEEATQLYRTGRATGFTIRSPFDCLIAACALRNGTEVLHSDRDFDTIARFTRLQSRYVAL